MPVSCPRCHAPVLRIHRRPIDRLVSLFSPLYRYQCTALECEWTGNLPRERAPGLATDTQI
jgi:hypothetical protein